MQGQSIILIDDKRIRREDGLIIDAKDLFGTENDIFNPLSQLLIR